MHVSRFAALGVEDEVEIGNIEKVEMRNELNILDVEVPNVGVNEVVKTGRQRRDHH